MHIERFSISGLGHLSAMVVDETAGLAAVVDPRRDVDLYLEQAAALGVRISAILETHLHNDYVSGARDLAALTGATHAIGAGAALRYEHRGLGDGATVDVGRLRFTALDTPGHTPEHVGYTAVDLDRPDEPATLFSGGSLLVGAVGRTDLLGAEHAVPFAHAMYHSLHDVILPLGDDVEVHPTHGAGSLCSTGIGDTFSTTIGMERRTDPLLAPMEVEAFARALLTGQPAFPPYFARMRPTNQGGPPPLGGRVPVPATLEPAGFAAVIASGVQVVDARDAGTYADGHIPGSTSIPLDESFGTWLGWVVDLDRPVALVVDRAGDVDELMRQAIRIGRDSAAGVLVGLDAWRAEGRPMESTGRTGIAALARALETGDPEARPLVIDVRQATEYETGHVPGAWNLNAGSLPDHLASLPRDRPIATMCAAGFRASIAASLLRAGGFSEVVWVDAGFPDWQAAGYPVERGAGGGRGPA